MCRECFHSTEENFFRGQGGRRRVEFFWKKNNNKKKKNPFERPARWKYYARDKTHNKADARSFPAFSLPSSYSCSCSLLTSLCAVWSCWRSLFITEPHAERYFVKIPFCIALLHPLVPVPFLSFVSFYIHYFGFYIPRFFLSASLFFLVPPPLLLPWDLKVMVSHL